MKCAQNVKMFVNIQFTLESADITRLDQEVKKLQKRLVESFKASPIYDNHQDLLVSTENFMNELLSKKLLEQPLLLLH